MGFTENLGFLMVSRLPSIRHFPLSDFRSGHGVLEFRIGGFIRLRDRGHNSHNEPRQKRNREMKCKIGHAVACAVFEHSFALLLGRSTEEL